MATLSVAGFSTFTYSYAGGSLVFDTPFALGVLSPDHVQAFVVDEFDGLGEQIYRDCTYDAINGTTTVVGPIPDPCSIVLQRTVPKNTLFVSFANGADVTRTNIDIAVKYTLMALHETLDGRWSNVAFDALIAASNAAIAARNEAQEYSERIQDIAYQTTHNIQTAKGVQTYTLAFVPGEDNLFVTLNGQRIFKSSPGFIRDYTISGQTITLVDPVAAVGNLDYTRGRLLADLTNGPA